MKTKLAIFLMCFIFLMPKMTHLSAQVTIGSNLEPAQGALLDLKEEVEDEPVGSLVTASTGGFLLPRVKLVKRKELNPLVAGATKEVKLLHTGLVVYNLQKVEEEDLQVGMNYWDGEKWNPLIMQEVGQAEFSILNCDGISIAGEYRIGTALGAGNVMKMKVSVTKKGLYSILAQADPFNGYYFFIEGEFKATGTFEIQITGAGTPVIPKENPLFDLIVIDLNGKRASCTKELEIKDSAAIPKFALSCNSVKVNGIYKKGMPLDGENTITMTIDVEAGTEGAPYHVYTDEIDGIKFEGTGVLSGAGSTNIILYGSGTPTDFNPKTFTISTNSQSSSATCTATIQPVIAKKKIVNIGSTTWSIVGKKDVGCGAMIEDIMNYGNNVNSIIKYEGFSNVTTETSLANSSSGDKKLAKYTGEDGVSEPYDIIIFTYNLRVRNENQLQMLKNYVNKGGILICLDQESTNNGYNSQVIGSILGIPNPTLTDIDRDAHYVQKLANIDDEILNGPFGDIRGLQIGDDNSDTKGITSALPNNDLFIYANATSAWNGNQSPNVKATMFRHKNKNFFWCGDGGLITSNDASNTSNTSYPFRIGSKTINGIVYPHYPVPKPGYGNMSSSSRIPVYNSVLFANVMAWALRMAEENGINSGYHQP